MFVFDQGGKKKLCLLVGRKKSLDRKKNHTLPPPPVLNGLLLTRRVNVNLNKKRRRHPYSAAGTNIPIYMVAGRELVQIVHLVISF